MASLHVFLVAALLTTFLGCSAGLKVPFLQGSTKEAATNDLLVGNRVPGDVSIYEENVSEEFSLTGVLTLSRVITAPENYVITHVKAVVTEPTAATVSIVAGGPEYGFVELKFVSEWWRGIYFKVEVFAKPSRR